MATRYLSAWAAFDLWIWFVNCEMSSTCCEGWEVLMHCTQASSLTKALQSALWTAASADSRSGHGRIAHMHQVNHEVFDESVCWHSGDWWGKGRTRTMGNAEQICLSPVWEDMPQSARFIVSGGRSCQDPTRPFLIPFPCDKSKKGAGKLNVTEWTFGFSSLYWRSERGRFTNLTETVCKQLELL